MLLSQSLSPLLADTDLEEALGELVGLGDLPTLGPLVEAGDDNASGPAGLALAAVAPAPADNVINAKAAAAATKRARLLEMVSDVNDDMKIPRPVRFSRELREMRRWPVSLWLTSGWVRPDKPEGQSLLRLDISCHAPLSRVSPFRSFVHRAPGWASDRRGCAQNRSEYCLLDTISHSIPTISSGCAQGLSRAGLSRHGLARIRSCVGVGHVRGADTSGRGQVIG